MYFFLRNPFSFLVFLVLAAFLIACAEPIEPTAMPVQMTVFSSTTIPQSSSTSTLIPTVGETAVSSNTPQPTAILLPSSTGTPLNTATIPLSPTNPPETPTPTLPSANNPSQGQDKEESVDACMDTTLVFEFGMFTKGTVRWRFDDADKLHCCEPTGAVYQLNRHPDLSSNLALVSVITDGSTLPQNSANILVDLTSGAYKVLESDYIGEPRYKFAWLPNEEAVWMDRNGELYVGTIELQEPLNAPSKMADLWFLPPDQILARDEALQFWFFDLTNTVWTQLATNESEKIIWKWIDYAAASEDGDYMFFFFHDSVATLTAHSKTVNVIEREALYPMISSGSGEETYPWHPPKHIKGTPYWFLSSIGLIRDIDGITYPTFNFIVDSRTGEPLAHEVLDIPSELAIYDAFLSPDGMSMAVEVVEDIQTLQPYPGQVSQTWFLSLSTGEAHVEDGEFSGWDAENQAYLNSSLPCTNQEITIDLALSADN